MQHTPTKMSRSSFGPTLAYIFIAWTVEITDRKSNFFGA